MTTKFVVAGCTSVPSNSFSDDTFILIKFLKFCERPGGTVLIYLKCSFLAKRAAKAGMPLWKSCCRKQEKGPF